MPRIRSQQAVGEEAFTQAQTKRNSLKRAKMEKGSGNIKCDCTKLSSELEQIAYRFEKIAYKLSRVIVMAEEIAWELKIPTPAYDTIVNIVPNVSGDERCHCSKMKSTMDEMVNDVNHLTVMVEEIARELGIPTTTDQGTVVAAAAAAAASSQEIEESDAEIID